MGNQILQQANATAGSQTALAKAIGKSQGHISKWLERNHVPAGSVLAIESATGIPRHKIRPDLYPEVLPVDSRHGFPGPSRKSIAGSMKGMVTFQADFNPAEPFWELHEEFEDAGGEQPEGGN